MRGRFITFEGADGCGKSTQLNMLLEHLQSRGVSVIATREPGGCDISETIRDVALYHKGLDGVSETLLMFAARREHITRKIAPALEAGTWVLCDRFTDSTFAYQGGGRGVSVELIEQLQQWVQGELSPDLTFYLPSPPGASSSPLFASETFENENKAFYERVTAAYQALIRQHARRIVEIKNETGAGNAKQRRGREEIHAEIKDIINKRFQVLLSL